MAPSKKPNLVVGCKGLPVIISITLLLIAILSNCCNQVFTTRQNLSYFRIRGNKIPIPMHAQLNILIKF